MRKRGLRGVFDVAKERKSASQRTRLHRSRAECPLRGQRCEASADEALPTLMAERVRESALGRRDVGIVRTRGCREKGSDRETAACRLLESACANRPRTNAGRMSGVASAR
ncbi:hypothetical protein MRX96_043935 [Rhipicephalus microplus]